MCSKGLITPTVASTGAWDCAEKNPKSPQELWKSTGIPLEELELGMKDLHGSTWVIIGISSDNEHRDLPPAAPSVHQAAEKVQNIQSHPKKPEVDLWLELCQISLLEGVLFLGKIHVFICPCQKAIWAKRLSTLFLILSSSAFLMNVNQSPELP